MKKKGFFAVVRTKLWLLVTVMLFAGLTGARAQASYNVTYTEGVAIGNVTKNSAEYFLYNIEADMFLTGGMDWGSRATVDHAGKKIEFRDGTNGYYLHTTYHSANGVTNDGFLGDNGGIFTDNGSSLDWVFEPVTVAGYTNVYKIKDDASGNYLYFNSADTRVNADEAYTTNNKFHWLIIPRTGTTLSPASRNAKCDYTYYLQNTDMNRFWERAVWAGCTWGNDNIFGTGGNADNPCGEKYHAALDFYQAIATVPNSRYRIYAQGFYRQDDNGTSAAPYLYVGPEAEAAENNKTVLAVYDPDETAANMNGASTSFSEGKYVSTAVTNNAVTNLRVGVNIVANDQWVIWDNFTLKQLPMSVASGTALTAGQWYAYTIEEAGMYSVTSTGNSTVSYTQNATDGIPDLGTVKSSSITNTVGIGVKLSKGIFYVFSSAAVTLHVAYANIDVTDMFLTDPDFSSATAQTANVATNTANSVSGWKSDTNYSFAGGVFTYGSGYTCGGTQGRVPETNPEGTTEGKCLGLDANWQGRIYYYQYVAIPAGTYTIEMPVYNSNATTTFNQSYFGFITDGGTNYVTSTTPPASGEWSTMSVCFTLTQATTGKICVGYTGANYALASQPIFFIDKVKILRDGPLYEVTNDLLADADFSSATTYANIGSGNAYDVSGWSHAEGATYRGGALAYSPGTAKLGDYSVPSTNPNGGTEGKCVGVLPSGTNRYIYYYQTVTLLPGTYTLAVPTYNAHGTTAMTTSYTGFLKTTNTDPAATGSVTSTAANMGATGYPTAGNWKMQGTSITVDAITTVRVAIGYKGGSNNVGNNPALFFDRVRLYYVPAVEQLGGYTVCNNIADLADDDYYYMLFDANSKGAYTVSNAGGYQNTWATYQAMDDPRYIPAQVWMINDEGSSQYSFQSIVDNYYMTTGNPNTWNGAMNKDINGNYGKYTVTLTDGVYRISSVGAGGQLGPYHDGSGEVNLNAGAGARAFDNPGYEAVAGNKDAARTAGFYIARILRDEYNASRITSRTLIANGWSKVTDSKELGCKGYEYLLLDCNENGVESGRILQSEGTGTRQKYRMLTSGSEPADAQKWWMGSHPTETSRYYLQNVDDNSFMYCIANWNMSSTASVATDHTDFILNPAGGLWTMSNGISTGEFVGTYANTTYNPYQGEDCAANKAAGAGKRLFLILRRPTGTVALLNPDDEGWEKLKEIPSNIDDYFYAYFNKGVSGLGLRLEDGDGRQDGRKTPYYKANLAPNTDRAGVWTLTRDPLGTSVVNTNITEQRYFLQTRENWPWAYHALDNGGWNVDWAVGNNVDWGRVIPEYQSASDGWYVMNGRLSWKMVHDDVEDKDVETIVDYGTAGSEPYYLGPWSSVDDGKEIAFNKHVGAADLLDVYAITRGKYVKQDIGSRQGVHDISYVINNPHGTQFSYRATHPAPLGWKQLDAAGEETTTAFWVQDNFMFQNKGEGDVFYIEAWDTRALSNRMIYQEYSDMPEGNYTLTVKTNLYDPDGTTGAYLFINGEQVDLGTADEHGLASITTRVTSGTLKFGVKMRNCNASWVGLDDFTLSFAAAKDVTEGYFANPSFELKNDVDGYLMGWTLTNNSTESNSEVQSITGSNGLETGIMSGVDEDKFFRTELATGGASKTLGIKTVSTIKLPSGSYRMSARIAAKDGDDVHLKVFAGNNVNVGSATPLNTITYHAATDNADEANGTNTGIRNSILFTLSDSTYVTVYVYQTKSSGTAFFKLDNLRLLYGGHTANIADYILLNPSFEYADAEHNLADADVVYSTIKSIDKRGTLENSGIYGWDLSNMMQEGGSENRINIGTDDALDYYYFQPEDKYSSIPQAAAGTRYFSNGRYLRNTDGAQDFSMSTTSTSNLPAGTYIANIKYKATVSYNGGWAAGEPSYLTFTVKNASTDAVLNTVQSAAFELFNRDKGGDYDGCSHRGRGSRNNYFSPEAGPWQKMSLIFTVSTPIPVTFTIGEHLQQSYATDIIIDDLRLVMMNVPEKPENCADATHPVTNNTEYYLMNAATAQFLMGDNQAGTHAALVPHGMPFKAEQVSAGVFKLESKVFQSANQHYMMRDGANVWVDQSNTTDFTIAHVADGRFTIKNGGDFLTPTESSGSRIDVGMTAADGGLLSQWYLISKADRENNLLSANAKDMDATFYIPNASFSKYMNTADNTNRWTTPTRNIGAYNFSLGDGTNVAEAYHGPFHTWKTIAVPNGFYKLRCQGFYRRDDGDTRSYIPEFYAEDESVPLAERAYGENSMAAAASSFVEGRYYTDYVTVKVTNNLLTLGLRLDVNDKLWVIWDNIEMELVSQLSPAAGTYSDITSAISTMTANQGFEGGQWTPYVLTRCDSIVNKGVIDTAFPKSYDKVDEYFLGLANTEFANAFYRGDFAEYRNYDLQAADGRGIATGWTTTGTIPDNLGIVGLQATEPAYGNTTNTGLGNVTSKKALYLGNTYTATYGDTPGYTMPLLRTTYLLSFKYGGWGGASTITLTGVDGDGSTALAFKKPDGSGDATTTLSGTQTDNANGWKTFTATITPAHAGNCKLNFAVSGTTNAVIADLELYPYSMDIDPDTYYIYNVGAEKYLTSGGKNGISAVLTEYGGLDVGVASYRSGMSFDTGIHASDDYHYLGNTNYVWSESPKVETIRCDTIRSVWYAADAGVVSGVQQYYLYNASHKYLRNNGGAIELVDEPGSFTTDYKWVMKTYADRVQEMKDLTADGHTTIDATFLMPAADFKYRDSRWGSWHVALDRIYTGEHIDPATFGEANYERTDGVLWDDGTTNTYTTGGSGGVQVRVGGYNENYVFEAWQHGIDMYQDLTTKDGVYLPHGVYTLSAQCADSYTNYPRSYLYIGDVDNDVRYDRKHNAYAYDSTLVDYHDLTGHAFLEVDKNLEWERSLSKYFLDEGDNLRVSVTSFVFGDSDDDTHNNPATFRVGIRQNSHGFHGAANAADGGQWLVFDNFRLTYRPFFDGSSTADDLANDSQTLYTEMEEDYLTNVDDEKPFCVPTDDPAYVALTGTYMSNLKKLKTSTNTDKIVRDTYLGVRRQAPNYVEDALINPPSLVGDPRFSLVSKAEGYWINNDAIPIAIDWTNKAMTMRGGYNADGNVTMAYDGTYDSNEDHITSPYPSAFTFTPAAGTNCFTLSYKDHNNVTRYLCRGTEVGSPDTWRDSQIRTTTTAGDALIFRVIPQTTADGIWYLKNTHVGDEDKTSALVNLIGNEKNHDIYTGNKNYAIRIVDGKLTLPVTVKEGYDYSTIILPYEAVLPSSITAWSVTKIADGTDVENDGPAGTIVLTQKSTIDNDAEDPDKADASYAGKTRLKACVPYLICAPENGTPTETTQSYSNYGVAYTGQDGGYGYYSDFNSGTGTYGQADIFFEGALEGSQALGYGLVVPMSSTDEYYNTYLLTKRGEVKFYRYNSSATTAYCQANKAFLRVKRSVVGSTKDEIVFPDHFWDLDDAIDETTGEPVRITGIYNMNGIKMPKLQKGLNIVVKSDGSTVKVMVK